MERKILALLALIATSFTFAQFPHTRVYSTFDNLPLTQSDTFNNGADRSGGFTHYGRFFNNEYDTPLGLIANIPFARSNEDAFPQVKTTSLSRTIPIFTSKASCFNWSKYPVPISEYILN